MVMVVSSNAVWSDFVLSQKFTDGAKKSNSFQRGVYLESDLPALEREGMILAKWRVLIDYLELPSATQSSIWYVQ